MFKSYLRIAWRNLAKNKVSSFINILGLAVGMAVAMLNGVWIWDEFSFNTYHQNYDRIAQVMGRETHDGEQGINSSVSYPLAMELKTNYRDNFKHLVIASWTEDCILSTAEKKVSGRGQYMEEDAPARALFGNADPVNKMMKINNKTHVKVTGVYEDLPLNSQFNSLGFISPFELWVSQNDWIKKRAAQEWDNHFLRIYAEINPTTSFDKASAAIKDAERKNAAFFTKGFNDPQDFLYPMSKWHLYSFRRGVVDNEPIRMVWLVGSIGVIVLLLACINFMNLSTARSEKRAKEVGVRKAIGSARGQLVNQFFSESFLVVIFAFGLATVLVSVALPWFNNLAAKQMAMPWDHPYFWVASLVFIFITGLLAGSYPALYLSSFSPVKVLKGTEGIRRFRTRSERGTKLRRSSFRAGRSASIPRRVMVVVQFSVSIILVICTIVVYRQIQYAKNRPVGYDREGLITMEMKSDDFYGKYDLLRNELKNTGAVAEMSASMGQVTGLWSNNNGFSWKGMSSDMASDKKQNFGTLAVTPEHGKTVGWRFVQGRDFSRKFATDSSGVVINEAAAKYIGWQNPVGETLRWKFWSTEEVMDYTVLGVIKDMVMESPYEPVKPTFFFLKSLNGRVNWINIKIAPAISAAYALPKIEKVFKKIIPSAPFDYKFVDEEEIQLPD